MNLAKAVLLKLIAAFLFAMMSMLVRWLGLRYPVGQVVFFRSAFAIVPVVIIYAWRRELMAAIRIGRPWRHLGRGLTAVGAMFCNFSSLARLPVVDATAIQYVSPLFTVALSAIFLKERVRIYRWSAVIIGFVGVLVMLSPHLDVDRSTTNAVAVAGATFGLIGAFFSACSTVQTRSLARSETTSSIVLYFSIICAIAGPRHAAVRLADAELGRARRAGGHRNLRRPRPHLPDRELPARGGVAGGAVRLHLDAVGAACSATSCSANCPAGRCSSVRAIIAAAGLFVIWRERQLGLQRARAAEGPPTAT